MCLDSFVAGLSGNSRHFVRFSNPKSMSQALATAHAVTEAERQVKPTEIFYTGLKGSCASLSRRSYENGSSRLTADARAPTKHQESTHSTPRNAQVRATSRCYECEGRGRFARECPTSLKGEGKPLMLETSNPARWKASAYYGKGKR